MDEYYSIRLSGEVKRSMELNARKGNLQSQFPYGYRTAQKDGKTILVPEPHEAEIVREIFKRYLGGQGYFTLARYLNSIGERTRLGKNFSRATIEYIICNPAYIGKLRWTPGKIINRNWDNPETIIADAEHEPLVDMDIWQAAQEKSRKSRERHTRKGYDTGALRHWLSGGIIRCSACGGPMTFISHKYFQCNNYLMGKCGTSQHIRADILNQALMDKLRADLKPASKIEYTLIAATDHGAEIKRMEEVLNLLDRRVERIRASYAAGIDSLEDYKKFKSEIDKEKERIEGKIGELKKAADRETAEASIRGQIEKTLETLDGGTGIEERAEALREIIDSCIWDKSRMRLEVTYRFYI